MNASDKPEFTAHMQRLCAGYDIGYTDLRRDVYMDSLKAMSVLQFSQCVDLLLSSRSPFKDKIPKAPQMWAVWDKVKEERKHADQMRPKAPPPAEARESKWLRMLNGRFLQYLFRRRVEEKFTGNLDFPGRRAMVLEMARDFEQADAEGLAPSLEEVDRMFKSAMEHIEDVA